MKLTKSQKHIAYIIMLEESQHSFYVGFCGLIDDLFNIEIDNDWSFGNLKLLFPELAKKAKYDFDSSVLFDNWDERRKALKQCINETA